MTDERQMQTVLLLEDDEIALGLYRRVLGRVCRVIVAGRPDDALTICITDAPDLFVADNLLRVTKSGLETLRAARICSPTLPLLLVSGTPPEGFDSDDFDCFSKLVESGSFEYLEKPFASDVLMRRAAALLNGRADSDRMRKLLADATAFRALSCGGGIPSQR